VSWDGKERRSDDHASRLASLEVYSKTQQLTIRELKDELRVIRLLIESISRDVHSAKVGMRLVMGVSALVGSAIGGAIAYFR
jgi:hypothetical protein